MTHLKTTNDLGIDGMVTADGICLTQVSPTGLAAQWGLEPGDVIVSVLGYPVGANNNWRCILDGDNGYLRLQIRDYRTGAVVTRYATAN